MRPRLRSLARGRPAALGMVHVQALPGTPRCFRPVRDTVKAAVEEAHLLQRAGFDGILLENMHDLPYVRNPGPEVVSAMTAVSCAVRDALGDDAFLGIQILAGANKEALAVAHAADLNCIRAEGFVFGHVADEGWMDACAGDLLRYRRLLGAYNVEILCDVKKKHSAHAVTADVSLADTVRAASFFDADGVIVTGTATGDAADPADVREAARAGTGCSVLVGSGVTEANVGAYAAANAVIVGSSIKEWGSWRQAVDEAKAASFVRAVRALGEGAE